MAEKMGWNIPAEYEARLSQTKKSLSKYPGHVNYAKALGKLVSQEIVAAMIACMIQECGTDHTQLNRVEYEGRGSSGTEGWRCGEGIVQWTHWDTKEKYIKRYNADSRSTQKLPSTWESYSKGEPVNKNGKLCAVQDGRHIAGLNYDNHMLFLMLYYRDVLSDCNKEKNNLANIVARIYQKKCASGLYKEVNDPVIRAYKTGLKRHPDQNGLHFLQVLRLAKEYYYGETVPPGATAPINGDQSTNTYDYTPKPPIDPKNVPEVSGMSKSNKTTKGVVLGSHIRQK